MADKRGLVCVATLHGLHKVGESVTAGVGHTVVNAQSQHQWLESLTPELLIAHGVVGALLGEEVISVCCCQPLDDRENLWADGNDAVCASFCFSAADETLVLCVERGFSEFQHFTGPESGINHAVHIVGVWHNTDGLADGFDLLGGKRITGAFFEAAAVEMFGGVAADNSVLDGELENQRTDGSHVVSCTAATITFVQAMLEFCQFQFAQCTVVQLDKMTESGHIALHGRVGHTRRVEFPPAFVYLIEGLSRLGGVGVLHQSGAIHQCFGLALESALCDALGDVFSVFVHSIPNRSSCSPSAAALVGIPRAGRAFFCRSASTAGCDLLLPAVWAPDEIWLEVFFAFDAGHEITSITCNHSSFEPC